MSIPKEFECSICLKLLYKPVTTSCGHNFCKYCIDQAILVTQNCPMCRIPLSSEYAPNLLLTQIINDRFPDEISERIASTISAIDQSAVQFNSDANVQPGFLPVYFRNYYDNPLFPDEKMDVVVNSLKEYHMIQYALSNESKLIVAHRFFNKNREFASLVKITSNNVKKNASLVPQFPVVVNTVALGRVTLVLPAVLTEFKFHIAGYELISDSWSFSPQTLNDADLHASESHVSMFNRLNELQDRLAILSQDHDALMREFAQLKSMRPEIRGFNKYLSCSILINMCILMVKRQLESGQPSQERRFKHLYGSLPILAETPALQELESLSLYLSNMVYCSNSMKWRLFSATDTLDRLLALTELVLLARDKIVINLRDATMLLRFAGSVDPLVSGVAFLALLVAVPRLYRYLANR